MHGHIKNLFTEITKMHKTKKLSPNYQDMFAFIANNMWERSHHYYRLQRSCGQGNIFTPVCLSVHRGGVCASVLAGIPPPPEADTPQSRQPPRADTPPEQTPPPLDGLDTSPGKQTTPPPADHPPPGSRHRHTVNERPVRILLECILVLGIYPVENSILQSVVDVRS